MSLTKEDLQAIGMLFKSEISILEPRFDKLETEFRKHKELVITKFGEIDKRFDKIDAKFVLIDNRFEQIDTKFEKTNARFDKFEIEFTKHKDDINSRFDKLTSDIFTNFYTKLEIDEKFDTMLTRAEFYDVITPVQDVIARFDKFIEGEYVVTQKHVAENRQSIQIIEQKLIQI